MLNASAAQTRAHRDDVFGDTKAACMPASRKLTADGAAEAECLGNEHHCTLLEFEEPLATFVGKDVALVAMLFLALLRI